MSGSRQEYIEHLWYVDEHAGIVVRDNKGAITSLGKVSKANMNTHLKVGKKEYESCLVTCDAGDTYAMDLDALATEHVRSKVHPVHPELRAYDKDYTLRKLRGT